jgi:hypothetical protein
MVAMTYERKVDRPVRWRRDELAWGLANADVHGLGDELERRTPSATDEDGPDDSHTYIINAIEKKVADAVTRVNDYLADLPQGASAAAHGFQRALSIPPRRPEGGGHESLTDDDEDDSSL